MIPYGRQSVTQDDIDAVVAVLQSDWLTQGPQLPRFEEALTNYTGARHAVAVCNATAALHLACRALDVGPGDLVWTSPITFVASANCARFCGADVDFVDIDPKTYNMSISALEKKLQEAENAGRLPKVVIPVHLCGQPCEMASIGDLARKYGFAVVEDASHAIGGKYRGTPVGDCRHSDITIFSFHPVKIITTGEGGAALTNRSDLHARMALLRTHGITRDPEQMTQDPDGQWYYQQIDLGYNYRITDLQAALGHCQMARLDDYVARRHELADRYYRAFKHLPVVLPWQHPDTYSGLHLYVIRLQLDAISRTHKQVFDELRAAEIGVNLHYIPVHLQPYYQSLGFARGDFPEAECYYAEAISLPMYPDLSEDDQDYVIATLEKLIT